MCGQVKNTRPIYCSDCGFAAQGRLCYVNLVTEKQKKVLKLGRAPKMTGFLGTCHPAPLLDGLGAACNMLVTIIINMLIRNYV